MILVITRRTYDDVVALSDGPPIHGDALFTRDFAMIRVPETLGMALAEVHPNSETAIRTILGNV